MFNQAAAPWLACGSRARNAAQPNARLAYPAQSAKARHERQTRTSFEDVRGNYPCNHLLCGLFILLLAVIPAKADPVIDRDFKLLTGALVISSIFDAETTIVAIKSGRAHEGNPIARPFVGNGNGGGTYAFALGGDVVLMGLAYELKRRGYRWKWVPIAGATAHVIAGGTNLRFIF